ncbi:hypothetical protein GC176_05160 [bacterium]|nr:hypothetical protein [bacterium]
MRTLKPHVRSVAMVFLGIFLLSLSQTAVADSLTEVESRKSQNDSELRYWLENLVRYHGFSDAEVSAATGLTEGDVRRRLDEWGIKPQSQKGRESLLVLPWPGGRHPRIGFLEGAIRPQRETKISVFTPWGDHDFVVVDVPEAIWSNLGLTYLAHTHIPTVFDKQRITLEKLEWNRHDDGSLDIERVLPNGIRFGAVVRPQKDHVRMELSLTNGTPKTLSDLRVQNCVMLKSAAGFERQTNENKVDRKPYALAKSDDARRWIITAWEPVNRVWFNERCPCLHSDPKFPDCPPGKTVRLHGWLSFYEGSDIDAELRRIDETNWRTSSTPGGR